MKFQHGMVAPLVALFVGVVGFPLGYAAYLSVTDYRLTDQGAPDIVGADNFVATFGDKPAPFAVLFALNLGYWYSWACLAPAILWLSRRFPLDKQSWRVSLPVHVTGVFVATTLHIAMAVATRMATYWVIGEGTGSWRMIS